MKSEPSNKVYACCGQYIAVMKSAATTKVICPRCGKEQKLPCTAPKTILIVTK